ncbi:MAG: fibrobacter succinogenes major paralogous domain-containing protein [Lachnospiraceae bacterium]|nr:fibrobacter succinogenes major paralogous domain-containing protein [Lachnospiraceae bacterium]
MNIKVKVLKDYVSRKGQLKRAGEETDCERDSKFYQSLLENGFVEKIIRPDFAKWESRGIKSKLANILIAPYDYIDGDKKYFTWDEAMELEKKLPDGWRLPTRQEMVLMAEEFGCDSESGELDGELIRRNLKLGLNGYLSPGGSSPRDVGSDGYYWSRTAYGSSSAYDFYFLSGDAYPANYNYKYYGYSVRCVKDLEK